MSKNDKNKNKGFLSDHSGKTSSMRVMSLFSLIIATVLSFIMIHGIVSGTIDHQSGTVGFYIILSFLLGAFAPKAFQSFAEQANLPNRD